MVVHGVEYMMHNMVNKLLTMFVFSQWRDSRRYINLTESFPCHGHVASR